MKVGCCTMLPKECAQLTKSVHEFAFPANGGRVFMHLTDVQISFDVRNMSRFVA